MSPQQLEPAYSFFYAPSTLQLRKGRKWEQALEKVDQYIEYPLNAEQRAGAQQSFEARLSLLWGPPGTGKTWTLAALIFAWMEEAELSGRTISVLVGASNYNAIDNVLLELEGLSRRPKCDVHPSITRVRSDSSEPLNAPGIEDLKRSDAQSAALAWVNPAKSLVVGATYQQLLRISQKYNQLATDEKTVGAPFFDLIVIDEASQVSCATAMAYATMTKRGAHIVVCGDHQQLGPIQHFEVTDSRQGLLESVFEFFRTFHGVKPVSLVDNYRSNEAITGWPSQRFYPDGLNAIRKSIQLDLKPSLVKPPPGWDNAFVWTDLYDELLDPAKPVCVISYQDRSSTVSNLFEAHVAAALVRTYFLRLKEMGKTSTIEEFWQDGVGLVTPHRAQIATIRNLLGPSMMPAEGGLSFVDTVDRFQGQERDLIIASYTVSDPDFIAGEEDFILDPRRFNVTLTRARTKFILLVSQSLLNYLPSDMQVATKAAHLQLFTESYCNPEPVPLELPYRSGSGDMLWKECLWYTRALKPEGGL